MARMAIHPGELLKDDLAEIGVTPTELARQIGVPVNRVTRIVKGEQSITADSALRLAHWFGTSAQYGMNLQAIFDLRIAEHRIGKALKRLPRRAPVPAHRKAA